MSEKIWKQPTGLDYFNQRNSNTLNETFGIEITEVGDDYLVGTMPVNHTNVQPYRILHGGANVCLAESLGSIASSLCIEDLSTHMAVGIEVNANHLRSVKEGGVVTGICRPIRVGRTLHVWNIDIRDQDGHLTCVSRLTVSIVARKG
jgi:1,4-dihydroxy-2-naphthoyl-CoA hydrolase